MTKINVGSLSILAIALCLDVISCNRNPDQPAEQQLSSDPAQANLAAAPVQQAAVRRRQTTVAQQPLPRQQPAPSFQAQPADQPEQSYPSQPAPAPQAYDQNYNALPVSNAAYSADDSGYDTSPGEPIVEAEQPPPPLPIYNQPPCPGDNHLWTPGYWGYASAGYYWVPGVWVVAPYIGALWTPPYWGFAANRYHWHRGYWGPHIGFYGGINYGFGYVGRGYEGGYWNRNVFAYNRTVNNVNVNVVHNVYNYKVVNITNVTYIHNTRVSYNGGRGGLDVRPTPAEVAVLHEHRIAPVPAQVQYMRQAEDNRAQFAAVNHGRPETLAAARPLATSYRAPAARPSAVPEARVLPQMNSRPEPVARPEAAQVSRPRFPMQPAQIPRTTVPPTPVARTPVPPTPLPSASAHFNRPLPTQRQEPQPSPATQAPLPVPIPNRPAVQAHPAPQPRSQTRPMETQPVAQQQQLPQHVERSAPEPRVEQRPVPQPRVEQRPMAEPRAEARPTPQPHVEQKPAPQPPHPEVRPAPKPAQAPHGEERDRHQ